MLLAMFFFVFSTMHSFDKESNIETIEIAAAIIMSLLTKEHAQSVCRRLSCTARREVFSGFVFAALDTQLSSPSDLFSASTVHPTVRIHPSFGSTVLATAP